MLPASYGFGGYDLVCTYQPTTWYKQPTRQSPYECVYCSSPSPHRYLKRRGLSVQLIKAEIHTKHMKKKITQ